MLQIRPIARNMIQNRNIHIEILDKSQSIKNNQGNVLMSSPSFALIFNQQTLLFNCPENIQRLMYDNRNVKFGKIKDLFLTQTNILTTGGLCGIIYIYANVGFLLSMTDSSKNKVCIHGDHNISNIIKSWGSFKVYFYLIFRRLEKLIIGLKNSFPNIKTRSKYISNLNSILQLFFCSILILYLFLKFI